VRDEDLVPRARVAAQRIIDDDPDLTRPEHTGLRTALEQRFADRAAFFEVG
jgi:hypothetical protein